MSVTCGLQQLRLAKDGISCSCTAVRRGRPTRRSFPAETGWQCHALECRGHGRSEIGELADLSIGGLPKMPRSFGNAWWPATSHRRHFDGSGDSAAACGHAPHLCSGLVLARPAWVDQAAPATLAPHREIAALMAAHEPEQARRLFETSDMARLVAAESPDNLVSLLGFFDRHPLDQTQALLAAIGADGPGVDRSRIAAMQMPTLVIGTDRDFVHPFTWPKNWPR